MPYRIATVAPDSLAQRHGLLPGDLLLTINGERILDQIDYQFLVDQPRLSLTLSRPGSAPFEAHIQKAEGEPLGLTFDSDLMSRPRQCANDCVFCFVTQLPPGLRDSLYVKDDDWRLSLMTGNYVTLTNLPDSEIDRIIRRRASPLYISIHATDGALRASMMCNPRADRLLSILRHFAQAGIEFHGQVVCCPGINDGAVLDRTLSDLTALAPQARSLAVVPVGLTRHREGLPQLRAFTRPEAAAIVAQIHGWQEKLLPSLGTRFVFPSDEFYLLAGVPLPPDEAYEDYVQIENGVGMLRQLETGFTFAARHLDPADIHPARLLLATGVAFAPFLSDLVHGVSLPGVEIDIQPIVNHFFGEQITVAGLVTGGDLIRQLRGRTADYLLLPSTMLRTGEDVFLDGTTLQAVRDALGLPIRIVGPEGADLLDALCGISGEEEFHG